MIMVVDISRAYFYAPAQRDIYIRLPPEDPKSSDKSICGKLRMSLYGTRDAGANWHRAYSEFLCRIGMSQCAANPCHFVEAAKGIKGLVHGDDFLFTGSRASLQWLEKHFRNQYSCKVELIGRSSNVAKSARFLNRVISYGESGLEFEADQRLVEALVDDLRFEGGAPSAVPGSKPKPKHS